VRLLRCAERRSPLDARPHQGADGPRSPAVFVDFRKDTFRDWFVSGAAFGDGPSQAGALLLQDDPRQPVKTLVAPGLAHSGLVSARLQGALRSPTFLLDKKYIHYRVLGRKAQVRLIIDGSQLIRDPI